MTRSPEPRSFDRITEHVYLGSRIASLEEYHRLRAHGVRACVDMKAEGADPWTFDAFLWLPTVDHEPPEAVHLAMGIGFLRQCERAALPVLVHCLAGVGRSATLVLAYLLAGSGEGGTEQALKLIWSKRPCANPSARQVQAAEAAARAYRA
jgi:predicted protein tyrosine phosphatase